MKELPVVLTPPEVAFAEAHHNLLLAFLSHYHLEEADYYGPLAERYLRTIKKYKSDSKLQRYAFSTILWYRLRAELSHIMRAQRARPPTVAVDADLLPFQDDLSASELDAIWKQLNETLTQKELSVLTLRQYGYSYREIGTMCGCSENAVKCRFSKLRKRMKKTIK